MVKRLSSKGPKQNISKDKKQQRLKENVLLMLLHDLNKQTLSSPFYIAHHQVTSL